LLIDNLGRPPSKSDDYVDWRRSAKQHVEHLGSELMAQLETCVVRLATTASIASIAVMLAVGPAYGQSIGTAAGQASSAPDPAPATQDASDPVATETADVTVTGSRIPRSGASAPTPVSVVSADELLASSPSTAAAALNNLPSLVPNFGPSANGGSGSAGRNSLNLRNLGITRTLTLVDGRRYPATATDNTVDTNLIPQALIQRVEVVTGGASAAYGSDAVAGVVNFILDKAFTGIKVDVGSGITQRGDGAEYRADATFGTGFAGGRGHLTLNGEYYDSKIVDGDARAFRREGANLLVNPNASTPPTAANPSRVAATDVRVRATYGGLITAATGSTPANQALLIGTQFLPGGATSRFNYGILSTSSGQSGGDGVNTSIIQPIQRPLRRAAAYGRLSFDVTDGINAFVEGSYAATRSLAPTDFYHTGNNALTILRDNAFLPATGLVLPAGITSFRLARYDSEPDSYLRVQNYTTRILGGLEGTLGALKWQAFYQYGRNKQNVENFGIFNLDRSAFAVDAVNVGGQIVCAATQPNGTVAANGAVLNRFNAAASGCVPFNPFGQGAPSAAAIEYTNPVNARTSTVKDQTAGASIAGPAFNNWAGEVSFAAGVDYRRLDDVLVSNPAAAAQRFFTSNAAGWQGGYTIWEGFGEVNVPLARDLPLLHALDLNGAVRYADYSTTGGATTWKVGASWEPFADLRIRATRSRDIRAPNPEELFSGPLAANVLISDPARGGAQSTVPIVTSGNPNLRPEKADTTVVGFVYRPSWLSGFDFSVDGYNIKIKDAIASLTLQDYLNRCAAGDSDACARVNRNAAGVVTGGFNGPFNFVSLQARGIDIEVGYRTTLFDGNLSLRGFASYVDRLSTTTSVTINRAGDLNSGGGSPNSVPRWRGLATLNYDKGGANGFLQMRYIGSGDLDVTFTEASTNFNHVKAQAYFDGQIGYEVTKAFELSLNVQNLLDKDPPFAPFVGNYNVPTNASLYDQLGRTYRVRARIRF
jgi:outer membrane receptor protein involved in Fe transport